MKQIKKALLACIEQINATEIKFSSTLSYYQLQNLIQSQKNVWNGVLLLRIEDEGRFGENNFTLRVYVSNHGHEYLLTEYLFAEKTKGYGIAVKNEIPYEKNPDSWFTFLFGQDLVDLDVALSSKEITSCFNEVRKFYEDYL